MIKEKNMAVPIVVGDSWTENSGDGFVSIAESLGILRIFQTKHLNAYTVLRI